MEAKFSKNPLLDGVTLTGGEPFCQAAACAELAQRAHARGLNVWTYTGYTYEKLLDMPPRTPTWPRCLTPPTCWWTARSSFPSARWSWTSAGSRNQRLIDLNRTRAAGEIVLYTPPEW